jgi:hypothetical protein
MRLIKSERGGSTVTQPSSDFNRAVREVQPEDDDEGELEGWLLTLECGHQYWIGAEVEDQPPRSVWCQRCEVQARTWE